MQKTNYAKKKDIYVNIYIYIYIYGTNGLKTIECTHTRSGQKKLLYEYIIYKLFTHRYIVLHILVRARLRDQDLDVERAFFVRFFWTAFL